MANDRRIGLSSNSYAVSNYLDKTVFPKMNKKKRERERKRRGIAINHRVNRRRGLFRRCRHFHRIPDLLGPFLIHGPGWPS